MTDLSPETINWLKSRQRNAVAPVVNEIAHDERNPDQVAENRRVAKDLGVPPVTVDGSPDQYRRISDSKAMSDALSSAPATAAWLKDPVNLGVAKDDVAELTDLERLLGPLARAVGRGVRRLPAIVPQFQATAAARQIGDAGRSYEEILTEELAKIGGESAPAQMRVMAMQIAQQRAANVEDIDVKGTALFGAAAAVDARSKLSRAESVPRSEAHERARAALDASDGSLLGDLGALASDPVATAAMVAEVAAETLPLLVASAGVTAATRSPIAGRAAMASSSFLTENSNSAMEFLAEAGADLATPEAALEVIQNTELMQAASDRGVQRGMIIALFDAVSGGIAGQTLAKSPAGEVVAQGLAQALFGSGGEAAAQLATTGELDWGEVIIEGLAEFATAPIEVGGVAGRWILNNSKRNARSGQSAEALEAIDQKAALSKLKGRDPEKFRELMAKIEGKDIYVPADELSEYFQAKDLSLDDAASEYGFNVSDFLESQASGGDVAIPAGIYVAAISGTDDAAWFHEHGTFDPDGEMSAFEAREFNGRIQDVLQEAYEASEALRVRELEARTSEQQITDAITSQLRAAGRTASTAKAEAAPLAAFFRVMADRVGLPDAMDLFTRFGLDIRGPEQQVGRRRGQMDAMLNTLRAKGDKALAPTGDSLLAFIRSQGGLRDAGGDVEAMGVPKGVIAETAAQAREREAQPALDAIPAEPKGRGLDEMGRAAIDAGYFPEFISEANRVNVDGTTVDEAAILLEAIREEVGGRPRYIEGEGADQALVELSEALSERGLDLGAASNDEAVRALQTDSQGRRLFQDDYRGMHKAPMAEDGNASLADLTDVFGPDIYGPNAVLYYGTGEDAMDQATVRIMQEAIANPDTPIRIYRAVPSGVTDEIAAGDWITINRAYAEQHGEYFDEFDIIEMEALPHQIITDGNSIHEFGYDPDAPKDLFQRASQVDQANEALTDTPEFKNWFGKSKVVDESGSPLVVYHGANGDFGPAQIEEFATMNGAFFTDNRRVASSYMGERDVPLFRREQYRAATTPPLFPALRGWKFEKLGSGFRAERGENEGYGESKFLAVRDALEAEHNRGLIDVYLKLETPLVVDAAGNHWDSLPDVGIGLEGGASTDEIVAAAKEQGYDGVIFQNIKDALNSKRQDNVSNVFVAFSPTQVKSVENRGTFYPDDPRILSQEKRGSIQFPRGGLEDGQTVINLFEAADLSTFLHESGHFFLEAFSTLADEGAPQQVQDDMAVIRSFLGAKDGQPFTRDQHEKWARAAEAYFMEGKAPSLELADAFARFKSWLLRLYRSVRGLDVKLNSEIREVFDRMLATDAEIAAAREAQQMQPLFGEAPDGMSAGTWATYQRMAQRSAEEASQRLLNKTMAKVRREKEAWWKTELAEVGEQVAAEVNSRREFRLVELMANKRWIGSDRDVPDMQLNRDELVETFGEGILAELNRSRLGGKRAIYAKGGVELRQAAEFFGFVNSIEMVEVLQNAGKRKDALKAEIDRIMTDRYGDPLNDGSIEEEALAAIHSDQQAKTVAAETRHLLGQAGRPTRNVKARVYRQRAKAMLGRMSVREATRPTAFLAAERKAAKRAEDAFAKVTRGDSAALEVAARHKEQQLLNHYLFLEARDLESRIASKREKMRAYGKKSIRQKLDGGYIEQIDALLDRYDFRVRTGRQIERNESLRAFVDRMIEEGREAELAIDPRLMDEARKTHYSRLSVEELTGLFDTIENIDHLGRMKQTLVERARRRQLAESVSRVAGAIRSSQKEREVSGPRRGLQVLNLLRKPDTIMVALDGGKEVGPVYDELKRGIDEGAALEQEMQVEMAEKFDGLFKEHYPGNALREMHKERHIPGIPHIWTKQEIVALALNTGNESSFQRVMDHKVHETRRMMPGQLETLLSTLDENDWRFVQGMWDLINSYWSDLAEVHRRRTGTKPEKVEAKMMYQGAPSFVSGGYYPVRYDPTKGHKAARDEESLWDRAHTAGFGAMAAVNNGMTKQRQQTGGGRTVLYDLSVPFTHLRETTRFIALSEAVDATQRILKHPDVVAAFQETGNVDTQKTLQLWVEDTARGPVFNNDWFNWFARGAKNNFTLSKLGFNLKTTILQATGLGQSAAVIGKKNMIRGMMMYARHPAATTADVLEMSALMRERKSTFQKDIYDFVNDTQNASPLASRWRKGKNFIAQLGFWPLVTMQFRVVDMPTWLGAYHQEMRFSGDQEKAAHYADRMVVRAQDSGLLSDRAAVERGTISENVRQADVVRVFTTLAGYMLTKLNRAYVTSIQAKAGISKADGVAGKAAVAANAATDLTLLFAFEEAVMGLIYSLMTDEEDEEDMQRFLLEEMGMAVVGGLPLVRDAAAAVRGYGGGGTYGSVMESFADVIVQLRQGENDKAMRRAVGNVVGISTGLPTTATLRAVEGALDDDVPLSEMVFGTNPLTR